MLRVGENMLAIVVNNTAGSSDKYLDVMIELNLTMSSQFAQWNFSYGYPPLAGWNTDRAVVDRNQSTLGAPFVLNGALSYLSIGSRITGFLPDPNDHFRIRRQFFVHDADLANFRRDATLRASYFESIDLWFNGQRITMPKAIGAPAYYNGIANVTLLPGWNFIAAQLYDNKSLAHFDVQVSVNEREEEKNEPTYDASCCFVQILGHLLTQQQASSPSSLTTSSKPRSESSISSSTTSFALSSTVDAASATSDDTLSIVDQQTSTAAANTPQQNGPE